MAYELNTESFNDSITEVNNDHNMDIKQLLKSSFVDILSLLENYNKSNKRLVDQHVVEYKIRSKIVLLFIHSEAFWEDVSLVKDVFSYRFNNRRYPNSNIDPITEISTSKKNKHNYSSKESVKFIENNYIDEVDNLSTLKIISPLEVYKYFELTRNDVIIKIFNLLISNKIYSVVLLLYCTLCVSKELCHFAFNGEILDLLFNPNYYTFDNEIHIDVINPFTDKNYLSIIHRCMFYGFYLYHREECTIKSYSLLKHRHVIDSDSFCKIPNYVYSIDNHPFIPLTLSSKYIHSDFMSCNDQLIKPIAFNDDAFSLRGLYSKLSFWKRFDIFTNGIFNNIKTDKIYFGGSVISACLIRNPLELLFNINLSKENDVIYNSDNNKVDKVLKYWNDNKQNLIDYFDEYYPSKNVISIDSIDDSNISKFMDLEDILSDIDIKIDVVDDDDFDKITSDLFNVVVKNIMTKYKLTSLRKYELRLVKIHSKNSYKYYISGTLINRSIEIFRLFNVHPIGGVSRYHFACVRGVAIPTKTYNNMLFGPIKVHPSLCSFAYTGIILDYKWLANGSDTKELILKYYVRGCTILLNEVEHNELKNYVIDNSDKWGFMLKYNSKSKFNSINSPIFKPRMYEHSNYQKIKKASGNIIKRLNNYEFIDVNNKFDEMYRSENNIRNDVGNLNPIYLSEILSVTDLLTRSKKFS